MKLKLLVISVLALLTACGSTKNSPVTNNDEQIRSQRLSSNFVQDGIKIETNCKWYKPLKDDCEVIAIEATAITFTNGNSPANLRNGLLIAGDKARAKVSHFIREDISSNRVTTTISKNIERGRDVISKNPTSEDTIEITDKEVNNNKDGNLSKRENSNDTARQLTETIRVNSNAILRGFKTIRQDVVGPQEVLVTIRWDLESEGVAKVLSRKFGQNPYNR